MSYLFLSARLSGIKLISFVIYHVARDGVLWFFYLGVAGTLSIPASQAGCHCRRTRATASARARRSA